MANILVVSTSLNPASRSRAMGRATVDDLRSLGQDPTWLDLQETPLPMCDGGAAYQHPAVVTVTTNISTAQTIVVACPIYNYWVNAAAKNLIELTGTAWEGKTVGFLCSAGGSSSYMAVLGFANALMADFRCRILPRFVYAIGDQVKVDGTVAPEIRERIRRLAGELAG
ncbi:MAG: NADPH-dependent FMN reductase [Planctomycetota bacterium]